MYSVNSEYTVWQYVSLNAIVGYEKADSSISCLMDDAVDSQITLLLQVTFSPQSSIRNHINIMKERINNAFVQYYIMSLIVISLLHHVDLS